MRLNVFSSTRSNPRAALGGASLGLAVLLATTGAALPEHAQAQISVGISVNLAPPPLPVYTQPPMPDIGYIWQPGYWAWDADYGDYYWVPGTWIQPPEEGLLWTPGYWGWSDGAYFWHTGYWGPDVGFYGGINYGFGYVGIGYAGGYWDRDRFFYNRAYNNIPEHVHVTNVYERTVNNITINRVSFNGGAEGVHAQPRPEEERAEHERHVAPVHDQLEQARLARDNPALRASTNHGRPEIAATAHAAQFSGHDVVPARAAGGNWEPRGGKGPEAPQASHEAPPAPVDHAMVHGNPRQFAPEHVPQENTPRPEPQMRMAPPPFQQPHNDARAPAPSFTQRPEMRMAPPPAEAPREQQPRIEQRPQIQQEPQRQEPQRQELQRPQPPQPHQEAQHQEQRGGGDKRDPRDKEPPHR